MTMNADAGLHLPEPEQVFFNDPALDRAFAVIMTLAAELYVVKDRLRAMEVLLNQRKLLEEGALDGYVPDAAEASRLAGEGAAYVAELMKCVRGEQASKGAPADLMQRFG
jgi:hypothetical protein